MTQPNFKIKRGDLVQIRSGGHKGIKGTVLKVFLDEAKIFVEGVPEIKRHIKISAQSPEGFIMKKRKIHISNVSLVDSSTGLFGKVGYKNLDGKKVRFFKKSGTILNKSL